MTRTTNARLAGVALLLYIAIGVTQMTVFGGTTSGDGTAARLATMALRASDVRINVVLGLATCFVALLLGVTLYSLTREEDPDLAALSLMCRVGEGVLGATLIPITLGLLSLATDTGTDAPDRTAVGAVVLAARNWNTVVSATFFAVGSTLFSWLLLRGRMIPAPMAWLGVIASVLLVVGLPMQLAGILQGAVTQLMWLPMAAFEIPLGLWLIVKGVAPPSRQPLA
jgi:hypothetical protein